MRNNIDRAIEAFDYEVEVYQTDMGMIGWEDLVIDNSKLKSNQIKITSIDTGRSMTFDTRLFERGTTVPKENFKEEFTSSINWIHGRF